MGGGGGVAAVALAQSQADVNVKLSWALGQKCVCVMKLSELRQKLKEFVSDGFDIDLCTLYTRVQVERVYKSNPIFEAKNTTFLEKVWFFSFHQLNKINRWSGIQG